MDASDLIVEVRDRTLARVGQFSDSDLAGFTVVARANDVGQWEATLPHTIFDTDSGAEIIYPLSAALRTKGAGIIVTGPNGVILSGPMTEAKYEATADEQHGTWTLTGVSDSIMLQDALAYPDPSNADAGSQAYDNDERNGPAETIIKAYVSANIGPNAPSARKWADLQIQVDAALGTTVYGAPRFDNLLSLLQSLASLGGVNFDVAQVGQNRVFRVWQPQDRSALVRFDIDNGQLTTIDYGYGSPTATRVIIGGPGDGVVDRTFVTRTSDDSLTEESLWNRRIEGFISDTSTDDTVVLSQEGDDALAQDGVTAISTSITPSEDLTSTYMVDWSLGDKVTVVIGDAPAVAPVTEAIIKADDNGLLVGATLGDPTGFDPDGIAYAQAQDTSDRVASIERSGAQGGGSNVGVEWTDVQDKPSYFPADLSAPSGVLAVASGGTGAASAATARTNLGLGSLATKSQASLTADVTGTLPVANGGTGSTTAAAARTALGLGSLATLSSVSLTSNVSGTLPVANGGTGATSSAGAISALGITPSAIGAQPAGSYADAADTTWNTGTIGVTSGYTLDSMSSLRKFGNNDGLVILNINISKNSGTMSNGTVVATVPVGFRPVDTQSTVYGSGSGSNSLTGIRVDSNGNVLCLVPASTSTGAGTLSTTTQTKATISYYTAGN